MVTSDRVEPRTSTPCQKPMVANRQVCSSSAKRAISAGFGRSDEEGWATAPVADRVSRRPHGPPAGEKGKRSSLGRLDEQYQLVLHGLLEPLVVEGLGR